MPDFEKEKDNKLYIIFTDLDGTLLDGNYSYREALPVLNILRNKKIPVILCSAKTKAEQEVIRSRMKINHPFIVENGSAIYIPKGYFKEEKGELTDNYEVIVLGSRFEEIRKEIEKLQKKYKIRSYCNMTNEEVAKISGFDLKSAHLAKMRDFGETIIEADKKALESLKEKFNVLKGGKFTQVFGKEADKGKAVKILSERFKELGNITTIGIGNSQNDEAMLKVVDIPAIVKNSNGCWADLKIDGIYKANGIGSIGWVEVVKKFVLDE